MANEAHKEPTMEEILASIRKIIADDGPAASGRKPGPEPVAPSAKNMAFDNDDADLGMFEGDEQDFTDEIVEEVTERITGPELSFEAMLGAPKPAEKTYEPPVAAEPDPAPEPPRAARPAPVMEPAMPASPRYTNTPLTDDNTAGAAAGALGKLISKMDFGSENTLEGLVRELLKPMVKEWLDANLARIVEEKVEAEVQRIARMAR